MSWDASHCSGIASVAIVEEVEASAASVEWADLDFVWGLSCGELVRIDPSQY